MKKKLLLLSAVMICIAIAAAGTLAYFTADTTAHNVITSGGVDIAIREWADTEKTKPFKGPISGVMPSQSVTKIVEIVNEPEPEKNPSAQAWIRAKIDVEVELKDGKVIKNDPNIILVCENNTKWEMGGDGYYYYTDPVDPGKVTEPLITGVKFDAAMGNEYQDCTVTVLITAHAVQTAHNGESVDKAQGWPGETKPETSPETSLPLEGEGSVSPSETDGVSQGETLGTHEVVDEVTDTPADATSAVGAIHESPAPATTATPQNP